MRLRESWKLWNEQVHDRKKVARAQAKPERAMERHKEYWRVKSRCNG